MTITSELLTDSNTLPAVHWGTTASANRIRRDDFSAVPAALKSEWIKVASLRANKAILALTAVIGGGIAWALASSATHSTESASELFIFPLPLVAMLATVAGILMFT